MDNGVDAEAVHQAAMELRKKMIDDLTKQVESEAEGDGQSKSTLSDDVLDSKTGMSNGVDQDAVSEAPRCLVQANAKHVVDSGMLWVRPCAVSGT